MGSLERKLIDQELTQRREEGCDVDAIAERVAKAFDEGADWPDAELTRLYDELVAMPVDAGFGYEEPSTLDEIRALRPEGPRRLDLDWDDDAIFERIHGAWLGRAAGCALGKPVEGWPKARIDEYLADAGIQQLDDYLPFVERVMPGVHKPSTKGNIEFMDRDDDMDFPILGLLALESKGASMTPRTIANTWLAHMPFNLLYTAENVAYRNFVMGIWPPDSAHYRNPFREWIGAQIRADIFGYAAPGWPEKAAELAFNDACVSHDKNGIYGEMFVAAMIAAAFVHANVDEIVTIGLSEIPARCRLSEAVRDTQKWCAETDDWNVVWEKIHERYGHYHGVHTINNAALVVLGLYFGEQDFERGITTTVCSGWDTDCNGATVGSILGAKFGAAALPEKWVGVLNDRLLSAVRGQNDNRFSDLARRTLEVARNVKSAKPREERAVHQAPAEIAGIWKLETGWGRQLLQFPAGTIEFVGSDFGPYQITSSILDHGVLKFSFDIDKGGWDYEVDFEGELNGDDLRGAYFPGDVPVRGRRASTE